MKASAGKCSGLHQILVFILHIMCIFPCTLTPMLTTKGALELLHVTEGSLFTAALPRGGLSWLWSRHHGVKIGKKSFRNWRR